MPFMGDIGQMGYVQPSQIPNLSLWYNGSALTTTVNGVSQNNFTFQSGTQVKTWNDLSGTGHASNAVGAAYPDYVTNIQNGLSAVLYTSANQDNLDINPLSWLTSSTTGFTMYFIARPTSLPASVIPLVATDTELGVWWNGTNWTVGQSVGNYGTVSVTNDTTKFHMYGMIFDGTQTGNANRQRFRYDKSTKTLSFTGTIGANTNSGGQPSYFFFGGDNRSKSVSNTFYNTFMDGYMAEVMMWTRALTAAEINSVELYLNTKWGLGLV